MSGRRVEPSPRTEQELLGAAVTASDAPSQAAQRVELLVLQEALEREVHAFLGRSRYE